MQDTKHKFNKAKKSLGQNFLKSIPALNKIIEAGEISNKDIILEIGPGKGAFTKKLLEKAQKVIAVEKDNDLIKFLEEKFSEEIKKGKLILINEDILEQNILERTLGRSVDDVQRNFSAEKFRGESEDILRKYNSKTFYPSPEYKIIANIPYNITGAILKKFLTEKNQPERMILMIQNEVAQRIVGIKKTPTSHKAIQVKESILSISVKAYGEPKIIMKVPARYFSPAPKVDSAIIAIKNISREFFIKNKINEEKFWTIIHAGFAHKRKKLSSNLKNIQKKYNFSIQKEIGDKRAEDLSLLDWTLLTK